MADWQKALRLLQAAGYVVNVTEVLAVEVADRPGGLAEVLELFEKSEVNIEMQSSRMMPEPSVPSFGEAGPHSVEVPP